LRCDIESQSGGPPDEEVGVVRKVGILLANGVIAIAFSAASASAISSPQTFSLLEVNGNNNEPLGGFNFNRPPVGGDRIASANRLYTWAGRKARRPVMTR
jgi:hypothetical protein